MMPMARFRNLLVHQYGQIDDRRLYRILQASLGDLERYLSEVASYLEEEI